jgi:hypothetical protein
MYVQMLYQSQDEGADK